MTQSRLFFALSCSLLMAIGCGEADRKYSRSDNGNNGSNNGTSPVNNGTTPVNNGTTPVNNGTTPVNNGTTPVNNGTTPVNNGTTPVNNGTTPVNNGTTPVNNGTTPTNNGTTPTNNGTTPVTCEPVAGFSGQVGSIGPHDGGTGALNGTLNFDAGLGAILSNFGPLFVDANVSYPVTGALVTATHRDSLANEVFWIEDTNGRIAVRLFNVIQNVNINVGDRINFTATYLQNYEGSPQIGNLTGLVKVSSGNSVPYTEAAGTGFTMSDYFGIVRVWGTVLSDDGNCGGTSTCYTLDYGLGRTMTYRTPDSVSVGDCLTYFGLMSAFPGPYSNTAQTIQLNAVNPRWTQIQVP